MKSSVLSEDAVLRIKEMYEEKDARGRRIYSHMSLAKQFAVSETTILRVINGYGTFIKAPRPVPDTPEVREAASASLQRLLAMDNTPGSKADVAAKPADANRRIATDGRTEVLDAISGKWIKLPY